ncbi:hypothetical protein M427DRAFT_55427 [Gonapodya prolifera JEL478]|uniref:Uncharacterized protein n=1 Tax=Gonapodya prolifera (strain JEL478) TaxID=1344416 RepID=A0A139AI16_GONPJ|nr:hypothetical protein M427DRAFT_55427 [Gonapodya prolifera JEL478]|eukprot:KXS16471.1 hypothetical protein M427DRAFT_55427 [Gonapodya prolifera JEL478]
MSDLQNANPTIYTPTPVPTTRKARKVFTGKAKKQPKGVMHGDVPVDGMEVDADTDADSGVDVEEIDAEEVFDLIRNINDPEHPLTLEQLNVAQPHLITVTNPPTPSPTDSTALPHIDVRIVPTIPHCSMATLIGLCVRVRLMRCLPRRYKVDVRVREGSHASEEQVNKQLNDKERVAAAMENQSLLDVVNRCLATAVESEVVA